MQEDWEGKERKMRGKEGKGRVSELVGKVGSWC